MELYADMFKIKRRDESELKKHLGETIYELETIKSGLLKLQQKAKIPGSLSTRELFRELESQLKRRKKLEAETRILPKPMKDKPRRTSILDTEIKAQYQHLSERYNSLSATLRSFSASRERSQL